MSYNAQRRYDEKNTVHISLKLNRKTDADILRLLETAGNRQGFIKDILRKEAENDTF